MRFGNIVPKRELEQLLAKGMMYRRIIPVRAIQATERYSIETRDGVLVTVHPGDYILNDSINVGGNPWVLKKDQFERAFEPLYREEKAGPKEIEAQTKQP